MGDVGPFEHAALGSGAAVDPFFDLTVPEHAYLFGLIQTDGSHTAGTRNRGRISIELSATDADILHRLKELVPWYSSVRYRTRDTNFSAGYRTAQWTLSSWDARSELTALGLPPGPKAHDAAPPAVPHSRRDYVRGLLDGDGSLGFTAAGLPFVSFVSASECLVRSYERYAADVTGVKRSTNRNQRDRVFNPMYQTDAAATLAAHLYQPGDLALDRKANAARDVATWVRPAGMRRAYTARRWTPEEDEQAMAARPLKDIAEELGRSYQSVSMRRIRLRGRS